MNYKAWSDIFTLETSAAMISCIHKIYSITILSRKVEGLMATTSSLGIYKQLMVAWQGRDNFLSGVALGRYLSSYKYPLTLVHIRIPNKIQRFYAPVEIKDRMVEWRLFGKEGV